MGCCRNQGNRDPVESFANGLMTCAFPHRTGAIDALGHRTQLIIIYFMLCTVLSTLRCFLRLCSPENSSLLPFLSTGFEALQVTDLITTGDNPIR
jgi:hypothetical protein